MQLLRQRNGEPSVFKVSFEFDAEYEVKDNAVNDVEKKMTMEDFRQVEESYKSLIGKYGDRLDYGW